MIDKACGSESNPQHDNLTTSPSSANQRFSDRNEFPVLENSKNGTKSQYTKVAMADYEQIQRKKLEKYSFGSQFALSCFAIIFCGLFFGVAAMILSGMFELLCRN